MPLSSPFPTFIPPSCTFFAGRTSSVIIRPMAIPELIEIVPLEKPVVAEITVPGSKSLTNRALILAALADGETTLRGALWSEDTQVMVDSLRPARFSHQGAEGSRESCNRTLVVRGLGGKIPNAGTAGPAIETFCGQRRNRRAIFGRTGLFGPRRLSPARDFPDARTSPSGLVRRLAPIGLPGGFGRTTGCRRSFLEPGRARRRLHGEHGGKFAVRLRPRSVRGARLVADGAGAQGTPNRSITST